MPHYKSFPHSPGAHAFQGFLFIHLIMFSFLISSCGDLRAISDLAREPSSTLPGGTPFTRKTVPPGFFILVVAWCRCSIDLNFDIFKFGDLGDDEITLFEKLKDCEEAYDDVFMFSLLFS